MARLRVLKPRFFANESLGEITPLGRLLFQGLWCWADREGRLEDRPKRIKVEILPYDDCDIDALLNELTDRGFILRYKVGGLAYIQVTNFKKHQSPHIKEGPSTIPAPDKSDAMPVQAPDEPICVMGNGFMGNGITGDWECGGETASEIDVATETPPTPPANPVRRRTAHAPPEEEFLSALAVEYGPLLGSEHKARDAIDRALNHTAYDKARDKRLYVRNWLRRDVSELANRSNSNGQHTTRPDHGDAGESWATVAARNRANRERFDAQQRAGPQGADP